MVFDLKIVLNDTIWQWGIKQTGVRRKREQQELRSDIKSRDGKTTAVRRSVIQERVQSEKGWTKAWGERSKCGVRDGLWCLTMRAWMVGNGFGWRRSPGCWEQDSTCGQRSGEARGDTQGRELRLKEDAGDRGKWLSGLLHSMVLDTPFRL